MTAAVAPDESSESLTCPLNSRAKPNPALHRGPRTKSA